MKYNKKGYDYLVVGSGPYGAIFAYEAAKRGNKVLVVEKRSHIGEISIPTKKTASMFTTMVHISSIQIRKKFGIM